MKNTCTLKCPKCSCIVFAKDSATLISSGSITVSKSDSCIQLPPLSTKENSDCKNGVDVDGGKEASKTFWMVGSQFDFHNIGVSVPVESKTVENMKSLLGSDTLRFLACADCDIAPLGIYFKDSENNKDYYLIASERVV